MASLTDYIRSLSGGKSATKPTQNTNSNYVPGAVYYNTATKGIVNSTPTGSQPYNFAPPAASVLGSNYSPYSGGGYGTSSGGGSYSSGGGGGYSVAAQPDTTGLQDTARGLIQSIQNAYHSLSGKINPVVQDKVNQYLQGYDTQANDLNKQLGISTGQTQNIYGARGLQDSSFLGNALDENAGIYNQNLTSLNQDKSQKLGAIGQYAQGLQSSANAAADQYGQYLPNLGQYSASDLGTLNSQLQGALPGIQSQVGGMGTNQDFLNTLNTYAPQANQGASQLASKLQQLVTSSAPIFAKKQIASGLVKSANLQDSSAQSYWQDYFNQLLNGQA